MSRTYKHLQLAMLATSPLWLETVGHGDTINHGDLGPGTRVGEADGIPECEPLPEGVSMIPTLRTGWARMVNGSIHILLSDTALRCPRSENGSDALLDVPPCGDAMWLLTYDLPEEMQAVGTYQLSEHAVNWDMSQRSETDTGLGCGSSCASMSVGASFIPGATGPDAQLELFSINDQCITGRIVGLDQSNQTVPPPPELNGAFRAVRCD